MGLQHPDPPAAKFALQGDAHMRTNTQIKNLYYPLKLCAISIIGQKKAFCQQRIPKPSCGSLEHVEMMTEKSCNQSIRKTSGPTTRAKKQNSSVHLTK